MWITLSVLAGAFGAAYTYFALAPYNIRAAAIIGLKCFMLMYIFGWVIFRISRFVETTRLDDENTDNDDEGDKPE